MTKLYRAMGEAEFTSLMNSEMLVHDGFGFTFCLENAPARSKDKDIHWTEIFSDPDYRDLNKISPYLVEFEFPDCLLDALLAHQLAKTYTEGCDLPSGRVYVKQFVIQKYTNDPLTPVRVSRDWWNDRAWTSLEGVRSFEDIEWATYTSEHFDALFDEYLDDKAIEELVMSIPEEW